MSEQAVRMLTTVPYAIYKQPRPWDTHHSQYQSGLLGKNTRHRFSDFLCLLKCILSNVVCGYNMNTVQLVPPKCVYPYAGVHGATLKMEAASLSKKIDIYLQGGIVSLPR
jgi:hypothetical protein